MEIALISPPAIPLTDREYSGSERIVYLLARELSKHHNVTVIASKSSMKGSYELFETIPAHYGGIQHENRHFEAYRDFILNNDWDLIQSHEHFFPACKLKKEKPDLPLVWHTHDLRALSKAPCKDVPIFARSQFHAEYLRRAWNTDVRFAYNPIDIEHYKFGENREDWALFLGRIDVKGSLEFIEVCEEAGICGVIAGEDSPQRGINQGVVRKVIKRVNESDQLEYLGRISEERKLELLSKAGVLISPFTERYIPVFDIVLVEQLCSGGPVFTIDRGATPEVLGGTGLLETGYLARDMKELTYAVRKFEREEFKFNPGICRKRAEMFSIEKIVKNYLRF